MSGKEAVDWDSVVDALAIAADEAELVIASLKSEAKRAIDGDRFLDIQRITAQIEGVRVFLGQLDDVRKAWITLRGPRRQPRQRQSEPSPPQRRRYLGHVNPGEKTSQPEFWRPVLEALVELGGSSEVSTVLATVERLFGDHFKPADRELLPSARKDDDLRWRNTAQWARVELVAEGLMKQDSRRGLWEISDAGRSWLQQEPIA